MSNELDVAELKRLAMAILSDDMGGKAPWYASLYESPRKAHRWWHVGNEVGSAMICRTDSEKVAHLIAYLGTHALEIAAALEELAALRKDRERIVRAREDLITTYHGAGGNNLTGYGWAKLHLCNELLGFDRDSIDAARTTRGGDDNG